MSWLPNLPNNHVQYTLLRPPNHQEEKRDVYPFVNQPPNSTSNTFVSTYPSINTSIQHIETKQPSTNSYIRQPTNTYNQCIDQSINHPRSPPRRAPKHTRTNNAQPIIHSSTLSPLPFHNNNSINTTVFLRTTQDCLSLSVSMCIYLSYLSLVITEEEMIMTTMLAKSINTHATTTTTTPTTIHFTTINYVFAYAWQRLSSSLVSGRRADF